MAQQQENSGNSPGQGGGGVQSTNENELPLTGSRSTKSGGQVNKFGIQVTPSQSQADNLSNTSNRGGRVSDENQQGNEEMGIYIAIPSSERPNQYIEFDNLSPEAAHELTGMHMKAQMVGGFSTEGDSNLTSKVNQGGSSFSGETDKTEQYGHSGMSGVTLAPDEEDGRKTSPIRGGKGRGQLQDGGGSN